MGKPFKLTRRSQEELHAMGLHDNTNSEPADKVEVSAAVEWLAVQLYDAYIDAVNEQSGMKPEYHAPFYDISGTAVIYRDIWRLTARNILKKGLTIGTR